MKIFQSIVTFLCVTLAFCGTALAQEQAAVASNRPISEIRDIFSYFHTLANVVQIQVASDKTLREIAAIRPRNAEDLLLVHGIGPSKAERYGAGLLAVVDSAGAGAVGETA